ncbi:Phosphotransferase system mannitol/fructose-specific IIA domain (Ntr-type) [Gracilibacillus orientalis]|uniref:Ascorbate-specific PTS system EIIA component n=1 Tax=Gracilibacillus orientalis TaxID=334253 RepID=A0A1I4HRT4_9BACI|nr:PTS sugar transporter subunit IIA [Gracilibacillus orientalis]SFL44517.1 Phosphotransferase system mannitol/fructose-specific IIA domain (Ntr-type) [Gracilibacillus orientalis]
MKLNKEVIRVGQLASDWEEAVKQCGQLLIENGNVEARYVSAMVETVHTLGPYIVIAPGVALPHARPEDGVLQQGISVYILRKPVSFSSDKEAIVFIGLAAQNKVMHLNLMKAVAEVIGDSEQLVQLKKARTVREVQQLFDKESG